MKGLGAAAHVRALDGLERVQRDAHARHAVVAQQQVEDADAELRRRGRVEELEPHLVRAYERNSSRTSCAAAVCHAEAQGRASAARTVAGPGVVGVRAMA